MRTTLQTLHCDFDETSGIATITFDELGSPVNTMCQQWQLDLTQATASVVRDKASIKGIILASNKSTFFAGADLKGTMLLEASDAPRVYAEIQQVKKNFRTLETLGVPVVSCINGSALGGGWEVALIGHYRVAVDDARIQMGLPEITLGLIPGASGITKMTRLLGLMGAQPYILDSKLFNPTEGLALGLIDELVTDAGDAHTTQQKLREAALSFIFAHPTSVQPWDAKTYKMPGGTPNQPKIASALSAAPAMLKAKTRGLYPAPEYALCAMVEGAQVDFDTALRIETRYLARLIVSPVAKNMIGLNFFDRNAVAQHQKSIEKSSGGKITKLQACDPTGQYTTLAKKAIQDAVVALQMQGQPHALIQQAAHMVGFTQQELFELQDSSASASGATATPLAMASTNNFGAQAAPDFGFHPVLSPLQKQLLHSVRQATLDALSEGLLSSIATANWASVLAVGYPMWTGGAATSVKV